MPGVVNDLFHDPYFELNTRCRALFGSTATAKFHQTISYDERVWKTTSSAE